MLRVIGVTVLFGFSWCVKLELVECGIDHDLQVTTGEVEIAQYPWLGILYYMFQGDVGETRAVTSVILIHKEFVIGNAADIAPMPKHDFRKRTRVLLGEQWWRIGRRVRSYVLHPEYGETYNTLAIVQLKDLVRDPKIIPICPAPEILRDPVFYVMKFNDMLIGTKYVHNSELFNYVCSVAGLKWPPSSPNVMSCQKILDYTELHKKVFPVAHVPSGMCKDFYVAANLYSYKQRPPHVVCSVLLDEDTPCVWEAGFALVSRDIWGRWQLLGVGTRGPGCGAPARSLDMASYAAWVEYALARFQRITISKINNHKYVLRSGGEELSGSSQPVVQKFGDCDAEELKPVLYYEFIELQTDNKQFQYLTYNLTIQEKVEYSCLTLTLVNASATSSMSVRHLCLRENFAEPCYYYKGSVFMISVYIMFSDSCTFKMVARGMQKDMKLLDIQEWKWEEGTYYEDFSTQRHEYRGQTHMTLFGFEPVDQKMWVPDYDLWTTTIIPPETSTVEDIDQVSFSFAFEESTTTTSTTPAPKRTFRRKTTPGPPTSPTTPTTTAAGWLFG